MLFVTGTSFAQGNNSQARIVRLEPTIAFPIQGTSHLPKATMTIVTFINGRFSFEEFQFTVQGLRTLIEDEIYGLYITSEDSAEDYDPSDSENLRFLFNVSFVGTWHLSDSFDGVFDRPTITVFVVREKDDGKQFDPATDLAELILEGTSTLP